MKLFCWAGLAAVGAAAALPGAEPIISDAVTDIRSLQEDASAVTSLYERAVKDDPIFTEVGPRFWAWSKLAYDTDYHDVDDKKLEDKRDKPWGRLAGGDISVWGFPGAKVQGMLWKKFTGMYLTVGLDRDKQHIVAAFIGSNDRPTFRQDGLVATVEGPAGGRVSKGFSECYESVTKGFDQIKKLADENNGFDIIFTGHSLGGATAQIAAVAFAKLYCDLLGRMWVITYGAPRSGDMDAQKILADNQGDRMINYQHQKDPVTFVPAFSWHYANAGGRRTTYPEGQESNWFVEERWDGPKGPDQDSHGHVEGVEDIVGAILDKFAEHTQYFSGPGGSKLRRDVDAATLSVVKRNGEIMEESQHQQAEKTLTESKERCELNDVRSEQNERLKDLVLNQLKLGDEVYKKLTERLADKSVEEIEEAIAYLVSRVADGTEITSSDSEPDPEKRGLSDENNGKADVVKRGLDQDQIREANEMGAQIINNSDELQHPRNEGQLGKLITFLGLPDSEITKFIGNLQKARELPDTSDEEKKQLQQEMVYLTISLRSDCPEAQGHSGDSDEHSPDECEGDRD